jgi:hypothetical protein
LVEEDEWTDHLPLGRGQSAADHEAAKVDRARHDQGFDGVHGDGVEIAGLKQRVPAHARFLISAKISPADGSHRRSESRFLLQWPSIDKNRAPTGGCPPHFERSRRSIPIVRRRLSALDPGHLDLLIDKVHLLRLLRIRGFGRGDFDRRYERVGERYREDGRKGSASVR